MPTFTHRTAIPVPAAFLYDWHTQPNAFQRLLPPWDEVEVLSPLPGITDGARMEMRVRLAGPIATRWVAEMQNCQPGRQFEDIQIRGPFAAWKHRHTMAPDDGQETCILEDHIEYKLPLGRLGRWIGAHYTRRKLERMFAYRHRVTRDDVLAHYRHQRRAFPKQAPMNVLISGRNGLIGAELARFLTSGGHTVHGLTRRSPPGSDSIHWSPTDGTIDRSALEKGQYDAVVHLAGESIQGRWTKKKKQKILNSRTMSTRLLCEALAALDPRPKTLVCASAVGYYGDRGDEVLTEDSPPGDNFLADVCRQWEASCDPARQAGIRVVNVRIGVVLTPKGGALAKLLLPFKLGVGGKVGSGKQWWSWIALDDLIGAIHHALYSESLSGAFNATAPNPTTNAEFTKTLGKVLSRPTILPVPAVAAKLAFGQMGEELLLASARVLPQKLEQAGYAFRFPELEGALRHLLGR